MNNWPANVSEVTVLVTVVVTDFPKWRRQLLRRMPTYYFTNFPRKLHKNEEILAQGTRCPGSTN